MPQRLTHLVATVVGGAAPAADVRTTDVEHLVYRAICRYNALHHNLILSEACPTPSGQTRNSFGGSSIEPPAWRRVRVAP